MCQAQAGLWGLVRDPSDRGSRAGRHEGMVRIQGDGGGVPQQVSKGAGEGQAGRVPQEPRPS